jgi:hypothetical protein
VGAPASEALRLVRDHTLDEAIAIGAMSFRTIERSYGLQGEPKGKRPALSRPQQPVEPPAGTRKMAGFPRGAKSSHPYLFSIETLMPRLRPSACNPHPEHAAIHQ